MNQINCNVLTAMTVVLSLTLSGQADTIDVPGDALSIQAALDLAADGDLILVAPGNYPESIDFLGKAVTLRASVPLTAVLSGSGRGPAVRFRNGEGPSTRLEGFSIESSGTDAPVLESPQIQNRHSGGGMLVAGASPTVSGCAFVDNSARDYGGAVAVFDGSPTFEFCQFHANHASYGGAVATIRATVTFEACSFTMNDSPEQGGAVYVDVESHLHLIGCNVAGNTAPVGGAVMVDGGRLTSEESSFYSNESDAEGGAVVVRSGAAFVTGAEFGLNSAVHGGAFRAEAGTVAFVSESRFLENEADSGSAISSANASVSVADSTFLCSNGPGMFDGPWSDVGGNDLCASCPADLNGDGMVSTDDLTRVMVAWGSPTTSNADIDGSGTVGFGDVAAVLAAWGSCD